MPALEGWLPLFIGVVNKAEIPSHHRATLTPDSYWNTANRTHSVDMSYHMSRVNTCMLKSRIAHKRGDPLADF